MSWFGNKSTAKKVLECEERIERLERDAKALRGEWDDAYDRIMKLVGRFTKRAQQIEQHEERAAAETATPISSPTDMSHLDPISRRILERRQKMFATRKEAS